MERPFINIEDYPVTIVAGGPSLDGFDFSVLQGKVMAVNNAAFVTKPDCVVAIDKRWHKLFAHQVPEEIPIFADRNVSGRMIEIEVNPEVKKANMSGVIALDIAFKLGARRVYLLGFDGGYKGKPNFYRNDNAASDHVYQQANIYYNLFRGAPVKLFGPSKIKTFPAFDLDQYQSEFERDKYTDIWNAQDYSSANNSGFAEMLINKYRIGGRCLEIGAGKGTLIKQLQQRGIQVHGLDITMAGFRANTIGIEAPAWDTGLPDKSYDFTFSKDVLEHIPENRIQQTIKEIARITKKGTIHNVSDREAVKDYNRHKVHLTVRPIEWWREQFRKENINFYLYN
jgi:hypothetical protein